jgi:hypothetical protein
MEELTNINFIVIVSSQWLIFYFIINKFKKMGQELDALKASIADLEAQETVNNALLVTLTNAIAAGVAAAAALQTQLAAAIAAGQASGADVAALVAINTDLVAHTDALKAADTAATPK